MHTHERPRRLIDGPRVQTALKALIILALAFFLYDRITSGSLYFYINQRFALFTFAAMVGLFLLALSYTTVYRKSKTADHEHGEAECDHAHCDHGGVHVHYRLTWAGAFIALTPVLLGLLVPPQPLGAPALKNRELTAQTSASSLPPAIGQATAKEPAEYNLLDWHYRFLSGEDLSIYADVPANVTGFVYHDPQLAEDMFWLVRFTVSCCVADASPVNLAVRWEGGPMLANDTWLQVSGRIDATQLDSRNLPILLADRIDEIPPPNQPYLYR